MPIVRRLLGAPRPGVGHVAGVLRVFSFILGMFAFTMLLPLAVAWGLRDGAQYAYDEALLLTLAVAFGLWAYTRRSRRELQVRDGFLLVVLTWAVLPVFACIPLLLVIPGLSFTDAYFEAVSGLTATGATVLSGLDRLPPSINLWRTEMHWLGGLGVIVLAVAILPLLGVGGRQLFKAEAPGPMKENRLTPRIAETAKGFWLVYIGLTALCTFAYIQAGMAGLDALTHAFSTMSLGGFSSHDASLGHFDSLAIELITVGFALVSGISFATHFMALMQREPMAYLRDAELGFYLSVLAASVLGLAAYLQLAGQYADFSTALRHAAFNTVSVATTLGYATTDYAQWPFFAPLWMLFLASFVTCSGSAGGGIKMMRAVILYKQVFREILRSLHPDAVVQVKLGRQPVPQKVLFAVLAFGFMYMASIILLTLLMAFSGADIVTGFSAVIACINNTGPGLGQVGPASTYAVLTDLQTWICSFAMLLGRLEIFTLLVVLSPVFWRK